MRHVWDFKFGDRMRDSLGNARATRKRLVSIPEMLSEQMMKYWESPEDKEGSGSGEAHIWFYLLHRASVEKASRFNREVFQEQILERAPKAQTRDKKGHFRSEEF
ncbi:hypothetical protein M9H77_25386 [Catharanthus roseus]|uniref:Uncharacterized protein n=1 Tax=Catharanthus roseus TaxID=4058 RepID=A0ACC0A6R8_CATRO|nr:hypothetical protein M9H77_25386 [Catharanthus roseus]